MEPKCTTCKHLAYCPSVKDSEHKDKSKCYEISDYVKRLNNK